MFSLLKSAIGLWFSVVAVTWLIGCIWMPSNDREEDQRSQIASPELEPRQDSLIWLEAFEVTVPESIYQSQQAAKPFIHIVKWKRETLFVISLWYTGSGNNWRRLTAANPDLNAQRIHIGDKILIPEELLKKRQPLPGDFLKPKSGKKNSPAPPKSSKRPPKSKELPLYGPIEDETPAKTKEIKDLPIPLETID